MNIISNIKRKFWMIIFLILIFPIETAVSVKNINKEKNYIICKISTATDTDYDVLYDSQGRNISDVKIDNRLINIFTKAKVPWYDPYCNLNEYIIYTDSCNVKENTLIIRGLYRARIIYPIKRESHNFELWKGLIFWFELL